MLQCVKSLQAPSPSGLLRHARVKRLSHHGPGLDVEEGELDLAQDVLLVLELVINEIVAVGRLSFVAEAKAIQDDGQIKR